MSEGESGSGDCGGVGCTIGVVRGRGGYTVVSQWRGYLTGAEALASKAKHSERVQGEVVERSVVMARSDWS